MRQGFRPLTRPLGELREYLLERQSRAVRALEAMAEADFLADPEGAVQRTYDEYDLGDLIVGGAEELTSSGTRPVKVGRRDPFDGSTYAVHGKEVTLHIPASGPSQLWQYKSSESFMSWPTAFAHLRLGKDQFVFTFSGVNPTSEQVRSAVERAIENLRKTAEWVNRDLAEWRPQLKIVVKAAAERRRENLEGVTALDAALGIPIRSVEPAMQVPLPVRRTPTKPRVSPGSATPAAQRFLAKEVYQDIVHTIEQMTRAMERTPTATRLGEEEIRDLILFVLNANYEGNVHGEVFNGKGKTDLLLTWEGNNAFIGECKVWRGPKKFREAIDQLLGYVTWRDTKAALVLFIKRGNPTDIFNAADAQIREHASYVSSESSEGETRRNYLLKTPTDPSRRINLALVLVVVQPLSSTSSE